MEEITFIVGGLSLFWIVLFWFIFYFKITDPWFRRYLGIRNQIQIVWHRTGRVDSKNFIRCGTKYCWAYKIYRKNSGWLELKILGLFILSTVLGILGPIALTVFLPSALIIQDKGFEHADSMLFWQYLISALLSIVTLILFRKKFLRWGGIFHWLEPYKKDE